MSQLRTAPQLEPLVGTAVFAAATGAVTFWLFDPVADGRSSVLVDFWYLTLAAYGLLHVAAGFVIGRSIAVGLVALPVAGAAWAEHDCSFICLVLPLTIFAEGLVGTVLLHLGRCLRRVVRGPLMRV